MGVAIAFGGKTGGGNWGSDAMRSSKARRAAPRESASGIVISMPLICGNNENGRFAYFAENVRNFILLAIIPPNNPNPATGWYFGVHLKRSILSPLHRKDSVKRGFHVLHGKRVRFDLSQIPFYPFEPPHVPDSSVIPGRWTGKARIAKCSVLKL